MQSFDCTFQIGCYLRTKISQLLNGFQKSFPYVAIFILRQVCGYCGLLINYVSIV